MTKFYYRAVNETGKSVSGIVEAESADGASRVIAGRGQIPSLVRPQRSLDLALDWSRVTSVFTRIRPEELILFSKQLGTLIRAGIAMLQVLETLESQTENTRLRRIVGEISTRVRQGAKLSESLARYPGVFPPLYCSMIRAGEASGALPDVLDRLIYIIQHEHEVKTRIRAALQYPAIVLVFLAVAFFVLLTVIVPRFARLFAHAQITLPFPTRVCLALNAFLTSNWHILLGGVIAALFVLGLYLRTDTGRYVRDRFVLRLPIIGPVLVKAAISRFASVFAILQASGVTVLDSVKILSGTMGNEAIARQLHNIEDLLREGRGIAGPLRSARFFPPLLINMVAVGEESGNLDGMLREVSQHYDAEVEFAMKKMSDSIGPLLVVCLAFLVGFFALAIYMPMWDLTKLVR